VVIFLFIAYNNIEKGDVIYVKVYNYASNFMYTVYYNRLLIRQAIARIYGSLSTIVGD